MAEVQTPGASDAPLSEERIREELNRVLSSHEFRSSKRSQDFLRYVVENALTGHSDLLKERTIGIEVFGRPTSYDPSDDATVRVKAGEVRKRLGLYYSDLGMRDAVRIELPSGTYVPEFRVNAPAGLALETVIPASIPVQAIPAPRVPSYGRWAIAAAFVLAVGLFGWMRLRPANTPLDQFWSPVVNGASPVLLCAAFVPVWGLDERTASNPPKFADFTQLTDQFVGGGDLIAASRLTAMLTRMGRPYRLKLGNDVSFPDLRTGPAILIGYSYTRWKEISSQMRYFIDGAHEPIGITDNGRATEWVLPNLPRDRRTNEDYAIVSRVFHPDTHAMLVEIAGITQYGTDAGGDLVTNPELMSEALRDAPAGWRSKNLQLVLRVKVISGSPSTPKVVAKYFW